MIVLDVAGTFAAATAGSLFYLVQRQRPQHRPLGRRCWPYTLLAAGCVAAVTTVVSYAAILLLGTPISPQALAFAGPLGLSGARAMKGSASGEPSGLQQIFMLGLPLVLERLDGKLADLKQHQVDLWSKQLRKPHSVAALTRRFHHRLDDRKLPGTPALRRRLEERETIYNDALDEYLQAPAAAKPLLRADVEVAAADILRLVYEAGADALIQRR